MSIPTFRILGLAFTAALTAHAQNSGDKVPGRYIVELKPGASVPAVVAKHAVLPDVVFSDAFRGFAGDIPPGKVGALKLDPSVLSVVEDRVIGAHARPKAGSGGTVTRAAEVLPAGVARIGAIPGVIAQTGSGIGVAVVDTGVDFKHPDLVLGAKSFKAIVSRTKLQLSEGPTVGQDDNGHGTHVGGIIAARHDGYDVIGVAPEATLYAVKVLDSAGSGYDSTVIAGLDWVAKNAATLVPPIKVVNMSLGRPGTVGDNTSYRNAVKKLRDLGITVVVSSGNDQSKEVSAVVPATYPEVIAVASTSAKDGTDDIGWFIGSDTASYFTTDGAFNSTTGIGVTISAPGEDQENIVSGYIQSVGILSTRLGGGTTRMSGTSMSSPHTTGVVALLYQQAGGAISPETVRSKLMTTASKIGSAPFNSPTTSYSFDGVREGVLDALGATGTTLP
ncbi:S8 family serine peptidase [Prosthecobacter sp.]|uniref:S8 family serine peptidase n=1 Tax=Prosthecobacter sp. TaxID=1965333 RepID=UPI003783B2AE